ALVPGGAIQRLAAVALPATGGLGARYVAQKAGASPQMQNLAEMTGALAGGAAAGGVGALDRNEPPGPAAEPDLPPKQADRVQGYLQKLAAGSTPDHIAA